ncbi:hypothetical protein FB567DRAFT_540390 [Paraphoma chrysanthemicola]|uniref:Uncharacterized protein n=1 Tax=Paraphoma chrysanthemicola TaxID=798071 RepID=A0A8K0VRI7_9PLEO|nr:hypothetical protein FB567DRAFT_540390 [Paraphoma chrysanthemicola]
MMSHINHPAASQADLAELHNAISSTLLRFPAEIRNRIYEYVLDSLVIVMNHIVERSSTANESRCYLDARAMNPSYSRRYAIREDLTRLCGLMFVCRRLYAETKLLPFKLGVIYIRWCCITRLQHVLNTTQLSSISCMSVVYHSSNSKNRFSDCTSVLPAFEALVGLKKVIWLGFPDEGASSRAERGRLVAEMKKRIGRDDIVVGFGR